MAFYDWLIGSQQTESIENFHSCSSGFLRHTPFLSETIIFVCRFLIGRTLSASLEQSLEICRRRRFKFREIAEHVVSLDTLVGTSYCRCVRDFGERFGFPGSSTAFPEKNSSFFFFTRWIGGAYVPSGRTHAWAEFALRFQWFRLATRLATVTVSEFESSELLAHYHPTHST